MTEYEWNEMPCVSSVFADKVEEINKHFDLLDKLLDRYAHIEYGTENNMKLYKLDPEATHPLKSGAVLMIYNFMESVGTELMNDIYEHIKINIADKILENLHQSLYETITKHIYNNSLFKEYLLNYKYTQNNLDSLIIKGWLNKLLEEKTEKNKQGEEYRKWFNGNVDVRQIRECLIAYGLCEDDLKNLTQNKPWPKSLLSTKHARNRLAHGGTTFTDLGRSKSLDEIKIDFKNVQDFFVDLLNLINSFLHEKRYLKKGTYKTETNYLSQFDWNCIANHFCHSSYTLFLF